MKRLVAHVAALLFCAQASAIEDPPYPNDATYHSPKTQTEQYYWCAGVKFLKEDWALCKARIEPWAVSYYDGGFNSDVSAFCYEPEAPVKLVSCAVTYTTILPIKDYVPVTHTTMTSKSQWDWHYAHSGGDKKSCPPNDEELKEFWDGYDMDGDGIIDRCYNPADKLKVREQVQSWCSGYKTYTPSAADEEVIKQLSQDALDFLDRVDADLASPSAANSCQLNGLANAIGIPNYTHPHFAQLANQMSQQIAGIKRRLQEATNDLSGASFGPRYLILDEKSAAMNDANGAHCPSSKSPPFPNEDLIYNEAKLKSYTSSQSFDPETDFKSTAIHESHHSAGGEHAEYTKGDYVRYTRAMHRADYELRIMDYKKYALSQPNGSVYSHFARMTKNPYYLVWMLGELKCPQ